MKNLRSGHALWQLKRKKALSSFNMQADFIEPEPRLTPNCALISFKGHSSLTMSKIMKRKDELLTTHGIDVLKLEGKSGSILFYINRQNRISVPLASTWLNADWPENTNGEMLNLIVGARDDEDKLLFLNLVGSHGGYEEHGHHTLIAGQTGSGKGVLVQSILLQMLAFNHPSLCELILVDPKMGVDYTWIKGAPHLRREIITDVESAENTFNQLVSEMHRRYKLLESIKVANIGEYNSKVSTEERLSRIFLIHDEVGDWMASHEEYKKTILSSVSSLGMKARASGIHLILITQRPDAEAIPTRLRDNMGNRLSLTVPNSTGSRMVLGCIGAEKLLGKGHLACVLGNQNPPAGQEFYTVQVPFADTFTLNKIANVIYKYWEDHESLN